MPVGFTLTASEAGKVPLSILTASQGSPGVDVVNDGFPALAFTATFCGLGSVVAPERYVKVKAAGVVVTVTGGVVEATITLARMP